MCSPQLLWDVRIRVNYMPKMAIMKLFLFGLIRLPSQNCRYRMCRYSRKQKIRALMSHRVPWMIRLAPNQARIRRAALLQRLCGFSPFLPARASHAARRPFLARHLVRPLQAWPTHHPRPLPWPTAVRPAPTTNARLRLRSLQARHLARPLWPCPMRHLRPRLHPTVTGPACCHLWRRPLRLRHLSLAFARAQAGIK